MLLSSTSHTVLGLELPSIECHSPFFQSGGFHKVVVNLVRWTLKGIAICLCRDGSGGVIVEILLKSGGGECRHLGRCMPGKTRRDTVHAGFGITANFFLAVCLEVI